MIDLGIADLGAAHLVGTGGSASVFAAQTDAGDSVAVKVLRTATADPMAMKQFHREAAAIAAISGHPRIVPILSTGMTDRGEPYLVMPLMVGSLQNVIDDLGRLDWADATSVICEIGLAIQHAHDHGVIHRDIKPANILLTSEGLPLVADFGIAKMVESETVSSRLVATPQFAPPERFRGESGQPTSDVYSLGATLHALVSGSAPFASEGQSDPAAVMKMVLDDPIPDLAAEQAPAAVRAVVRSAMAKDPAKRPATAAEFVNQLRQAATSTTELKPGTTLQMPTSAIPSHAARNDPPPSTDAPKAVAPPIHGAQLQMGTLVKRVGVLAIVATLVVTGLALLQRTEAPEASAPIGVDPTATALPTPTLRPLLPTSPRAATPSSTATALATELAVTLAEPTQAPQSDPCKSLSLAPRAETVVLTPSSIDGVSTGNQLDASLQQLVASLGTPDCSGASVGSLKWKLSGGELTVFSAPSGSIDYWSINGDFPGDGLPETGPFSTDSGVELVVAGLQAQDNTKHRDPDRVVVFGGCVGPVHREDLDTGLRLSYSDANEGLKLARIESANDDRWLGDLEFKQTAVSRVNDLNVRDVCDGTPFTTISTGESLQAMPGVHEDPFLYPIADVPEGGYILVLAPNPDLERRESAALVFGYIAADLVQTVTPEPTPAPADIRLCVAGPEMVDVRKSPDETSELVSQAKPRACELQRSGNDQGEWVPVVHQTQSGSANGWSRAAEVQTSREAASFPAIAMQFMDALLNGDETETLSDVTGPDLEAHAVAVIDYELGLPNDYPIDDVGGCGFVGDITIGCPVEVLDRAGETAWSGLLYLTGGGINGYEEQFGPPRTPRVVGIEETTSTR